MSPEKNPPSSWWQPFIIAMDKHQKKRKKSQRAPIPLDSGGGDSRFEKDCLLCSYCIVSRCVSSSFN